MILTKELIPKKKKTLRACLVYCNGYYNVIGIRITRNGRSCNGISILIHWFGYNNLVRWWDDIIYS